MFLSTYLQSLNRGAITNMAIHSDKGTEVHQEDFSHDHNSPISGNDAILIGFEADEADLPKGYFRSRFFLGSYLAIGLGLWGGTAAL